MKPFQVFITYLIHDAMELKQRYFTNTVMVATVSFDTGDSLAKKCRVSGPDRT
jgi:hypothetical protein